MISSLMLLIMSFADILIPYLVMCFFTEDYFSQKKIIVIYTLSVLLNMLHWHFLVIQLSILIMYIVLNKERLLQYHIKPIYIILLFVMIHVLTGYVCHLIISVIVKVSFTFEDIFSLNDYSNAIYELILCLFLFTIVSMKIVNTKMQETKNKLYMMIFGVGIGLCVLLIQNYLKNTISSTVIYSCLIGVFLYLSFVIFSFFKENLNTKIENEKINEQYKLNAFKLQSLLEKEQYFEELQKYKHDIKNNLLTLLYLYENEEYITAKNYLEKLVGKLDYTKECLQLSDHLIINAILNDKIRKNTHIKFKVSCKCSDSLFIEDVDLNMLLSNVLDNAIEYLNSHNMVDKYIDVNIIEHQNILIVSVKNPTYKSFKYDSNMGTTKKDKLNHGYGLSIVKNIVNHYDGNVEFESSNNTFSVNILLKGDTSIC